MELFNRLVHNPASVRKFIVALVAAVGIAVSHGLLPAAVATWVTVLGPFLSAWGIYAVPNKPDVINEPEIGAQGQIEAPEEEVTPDVEQEGF